MKNSSNHNQIVENCYQLLNQLKEIDSTLTPEELNSESNRAVDDRLRIILEQLKTSNEKNRRFLEKRKLV